MSFSDTGGAFKRRFFFLIVLAAVVLPAPVQAVEFKSRIVEVVDGDSVTAVWSGRRVEVRLWGVDAPEWNQPFGRDATKFVERLALHKRVRIEVKDRDRYTRFIARIILPNGRDLGADLLDFLTNDIKEETLFPARIAEIIESKNESFLALMALFSLLFLAQFYYNSRRTRPSSLDTDDLARLQILKDTAARLLKRHKKKSKVRRLDDFRD